MKNPTKEIKELADILIKFIPKFFEFHQNERINLIDIIAKVEILHARPEGRRSVYDYKDAVNYLLHKEILSLKDGNLVFDKYAILTH